MLADLWVICSQDRARRIFQFAQLWLGSSFMVISTNLFWALSPFPLSSTSGLTIHLNFLCFFLSEVNKMRLTKMYTPSCGDWSFWLWLELVHVWLKRLWLALLVLKLHLLRALDDHGILLPINPRPYWASRRPGSSRASATPRPHCCWRPTGQPPRPIPASLPHVSS